MLPSRGVSLTLALVGNGTFSLQEMVDGSGHPFLEFRDICIIHINISTSY